MSKTPNETQILADIEAAQARGDDPFGDMDDEDVTVLEAPEESESDEVDPPLGDVTEDAKEHEAEIEVADTQEAPKPTSYRTEMPEDYKAQRLELVKEKAGIMKKLMDGELDADEFAVQESAISDKLEDLTAQRIRAETLQEANTQSQSQYQQREIQKLIAKTKVDVDYATDAKAQRQFDMALSSVAQDPDNAGKDYSELLSEAHRVVLALRGVMSKGQQVEQAIKSRIPEGKPPVTLRNIPSASTPNANGDMLDQMGRLSGQAYEAAFAKLSPAQRRSLLDEA